MPHFTLNQCGRVVAVEHRDQPQLFPCMLEAHRIARSATRLTHELYLACDCPNTFEVIRAPRVGDRAWCSQFEAGTVTYVTGGSAFLVRTSNGAEWRRRKQTSQWIETGETHRLKWEKQ